MTRYAIALGSNMGDRIGHLRAAVHEVGRLGDLYRLSALYETDPVGGPEQDPYLNAVLVLESSTGPEELLNRLQEIELSHDRERSVHWGPRTLDLDLVAMDPGTVDTPRLQVPHPMAAERKFVLQPLSEVWPDAPVGDGLTAAEAKGQVTGQGVDLLATNWLVDDPIPGRYWVAAQIILFLALGITLALDGSLPDAGWDRRRIVGGALAVGGGLFALAAARSLGAAFTPFPDPVPTADLAESGPYRLVRHPIYGSIVVVAIGASLLFASSVGLILGLGLLGFFWAKASYEERMLRIAYTGYSAYRRRVRYRMLPFLV